MSSSTTNDIRVCEMSSFRLFNPRIDGEITPREIFSNYVRVNSKNALNIYRKVSISRFDRTQYVCPAIFLGYYTAPAYAEDNFSAIYLAQLGEYFVLLSFTETIAGNTIEEFQKGSEEAHSAIASGLMNHFGNYAAESDFLILNSEKVPADMKCALTFLNMLINL